MTRATLWRTPVFLTGILLCGFANHFPSPVWNAATLEWASGYHVVLPLWHLLFTPFCSLADFLTTLSVHQAEILIAWLAIGLPIFLGWRRGLAVFGCFVAFVAWGALVPRPMARLISEDPDRILVDFHSHTRYSHDGRPSFSPAANRRWHEGQGFDAAFITDHNRVEGAREAEQASESDWTSTHFRSLEGEEVSLSKTHLVLLGNDDERIDNQPYDSDLARIPNFVRDMHAKGYVVIASLPEYWLYHWGGGVDDFVRWGMDGFEIVNSAPKALDFPLADRKFIVDLCRKNNLAMTGISDNHGYGYATAAWNSVRLPGWQTLGPLPLEREILKRLAPGASERADAVDVLERPRFFADTSARLALSPAANAWIYVRTLSGKQIIVEILWIWGVAALAGMLTPRNRRVL